MEDDGIDTGDLRGAKAKFSQLIGSGYREGWHSPRRHASAVARSCPLPQPLLPSWSERDAADPRLGGIEGIYAYRASSC